MQTDSRGSQTLPDSGLPGKIVCLGLFVTVDRLTPGSSYRANSLTKAARSSTAWISPALTRGGRGSDPGGLSPASRLAGREDPCPRCRGLWAFTDVEGLRTSRGDGDFQWMVLWSPSCSGMDALAASRWGFEEFLTSPSELNGRVSQ